MINVLQENWDSIVAAWLAEVEKRAAAYRDVSREELASQAGSFLGLFSQSLVEGDLAPLESFLEGVASRRAAMAFPLEDVLAVFTCGREVVFQVIEREFPREEERHGMLLVLDEFFEEIAVRLSRKFQRHSLSLTEDRNALFRKVFEGSNDGFLVIDDNCKVALTNPAARKYLGFERDEPAGVSCRELFRNAIHETGPGCAGGNGTCRRKGMEQDLCLPGPSGTERWVRVTCSRIEGPGQEGCRSLVIVRDVTREKKSYRRMEENWRDLESIAQITRGIHLKIPCLSKFAITVRNQTEIIARRTHFSLKRIHDIKTAVGEACDNAIEHGTSNRGVDIRYYLNDEGLSIEIEDYGKGFDTATKGALPDPFNERGRGVFLMRLLMDGVEIESREGQGTKVVLFARRKSGSSRLTAKFA